ncbi:MAG: hypothetical protein ACRDG2_02795 [Actinomycetota bacterium]
MPERLDIDVDGSARVILNACARRGLVVRDLGGSRCIPGVVTGTSGDLKVRGRSR